MSEEKRKRCPETRRCELRGEAVRKEVIGLQDHEGERTPGEAGVVEVDPPVVGSRIVVLVAGDPMDSSDDLGDPLKVKAEDPLAIGIAVTREQLGAHLPSVVLPE